jgi:LysR family cys regulon transcriptional activator
VAVKSGVFLRDYVYVLLEMLAPELTREVVQEAIDESQRADLGGAQVTK